MPARDSRTQRQQARQHVIERCDGICEWCREHVASEIHHRKRRSQGGPDTPANLAALCKTCHDHAHAHPTWAMDVGLIVSGHEPTPETPIRRAAE